MGLFLGGASASVKGDCRGHLSQHSQAVKSPHIPEIGTGAPTGGLLGRGEVWPGWDYVLSMASFGQSTFPGPDVWA